MKTEFSATKTNCQANNFRSDIYAVITTKGNFDMDIVIERGKRVKLKDLPKYSVTLDGVTPGPERDPENHRWSFDHHENCQRDCTTSACMQTWTAVMLGLNPESYTIYCNDVDSDVCASIWCLKNPERCKEPLVSKLIDAIGKNDMHSGAFDVNGMRKIVEWICSPQTDSIRNGDYNKLSNEGLKTVMEAVLHRIDTYANGEHSIEVAKQPTHGEFSIRRSDNSWALIESSDPHAYSSIWLAGFDRIVLMRPQEDGTICYSIAKRSGYIEHFPLKKFFKFINMIEPGWGGSNSIGGSVKHEDGSGSRMAPERLCEIIDAIVVAERTKVGTKDADLEKQLKIKSKVRKKKTSPSIEKKESSKQ